MDIPIEELRKALGYSELTKELQKQTKALDTINKILKGDITFTSPKTNSLIDQLGPESVSNQKKKIAEDKGSTVNKKEKEVIKDQKNPISNIAATIKSSLGNGLDNVLSKVRPVKKEQDISKVNITPEVNKVIQPKITVIPEIKKLIQPKIAAAVNNNVKKESIKNIPSTFNINNIFKNYSQLIGNKISSILKGISFKGFGDKIASITSSIGERFSSLSNKFKFNKKETPIKKGETKTPYTHQTVEVLLPPKTRVVLEDILEGSNVSMYDKLKPQFESIITAIKGVVVDKKKDKKEGGIMSLLKDILPMAAKLLGPILGAIGTIFLGAGAAIGSIALLFNGLMDSGPFKGLKKLLGRGGLMFAISLIKKGASNFVKSVGNFAKLFFDPKKVKAFERLLGMKAKALGKNLLELPGKLFKNIFNSFKGIFANLTGKVAGTTAKAGGKGLIGRLAGMAGSFLLKGIKRLPLIGTLIGFGFAISRIIKGDFIGGLLDIASALATAVPVVGTALSIAIDVFSAYRDVKTGGSEKAGAANKNWMANAWKWVKDSIKKIPLIRHLTDMGTHIKEGKWGSAFLDIAEIVPGVEFIVNLFKEEKTAVSELAASGKPVTFASFLKATKNAMLKAILNVLPENFGIRSGIAKLLGISGYENVKDDNTTSTPPPSNLPVKDKQQKEEEHWYNPFSWKSKESKKDETPAGNVTAAAKDDNTTNPVDNVEANTPEAPTDNIQPATPEVPSTQAAPATTGDETDLTDVHKAIKDQNNLILKLLGFMKQTADNTSNMASIGGTSNNMSVVNVSNNPTAFLTNPMNSTDFRRKAFG